MKKVSYEFGCRATGYYTGELFVPESTTNEEIQRIVEDKADFYVGFTTEDGYEEVAEVAYRKVR